MKRSKALTFLLVVCLIVCLMGVLAACSSSDDAGKNDQPAADSGSNSSSSGGANGDSNSSSGGDQGNGAASGNQGNENGNGSESGNGSENGNGNESGNETAIHTVTLATRASIMSAIGANYKIVATGLLDGSSTTVASDGTYFYATAPYESFNKKIGDKYLYPYSYVWDGKYHRMGTPTYTQDGGAPTMLGRGHAGDMMQFDGEVLQYNTVEAVSFLGRPAKKYTFESDNAYGYNVLFHEEVTIDDATGACLRYYGYGRAGDGFTGSTRNKVCFEVTELSYGDNNAAVRTFLDALIAKIDVYEWDDDFIAQVGLAQVAAPRGELWYSQWEDSDRQSRDSDIPDWSVKYRVYADTQQELQSYVETYLRSFYEAGANLDDEGNQQDYDEMYGQNGGDDDLNLCAYVQKDGKSYAVYVYATYITYSTPHYWDVEVEIVAQEE